MDLPIFQRSIEFQDWIKASNAGERCIYHIGENAGGALCRVAMAFSNIGAVFLVRKPHGKTPEGFRRFAYMAIRSSVQRLPD